MVIWNNGAYQANRKFLHQYGGRAAATGRYPGCSIDLAADRSRRRSARATASTPSASRIRRRWRRARALLRGRRVGSPLRRRREDRAPLRRRRFDLVRFLFGGAGSRDRPDHAETHISHDRRDGGDRIRRRRMRTQAGAGADAAAPDSLNLAPVKASWDRIIRTTVGLRPHRDAGFVLKADKLDDKLLVHNYGHGGAGMSLAWGTGLMAAEFATEHQARQAAVDRLRLGRADLRAAAAAPRLRRDDLCARRAAQRDVEHVARRLHADFGPGRDRSAHAANGTRSTVAPPTSRTGSCSCSPGRISACRGSTTTR